MPATGVLPASLPDEPKHHFVDEDIKRTAAQMPKRGKPGSDDSLDFVVRTEPPGPGELFRRDSEAQLKERLRLEARVKPGSPPIYFPESGPTTRERYTGRTWRRMVEAVEPSYVCHARLLFEQPNFERGGWDLGVFTPVVNVGKFYYDLALLPYHYWSSPGQCWDSSSGKCLPGDPSPLLWYREKFSVTGLAAQAGVIAGGYFIFP